MANGFDVNVDGVGTIHFDGDTPPTQQEIEEAVSSSGAASAAPASEAPTSAPEATQPTQATTTPPVAQNAAQSVTGASTATPAPAPTQEQPSSIRSTMRGFYGGAVLEGGRRLRQSEDFLASSMISALGDTNNAFTDTLKNYAVQKQTEARSALNDINTASEQLVNASNVYNPSPEDTAKGVEKGQQAEHIAEAFTPLSAATMALNEGAESYYRTGDISQGWKDTAKAAVINRIAGKTGEATGKFVSPLIGSMAKASGKAGKVAQVAGKTATGAATGAATGYTSGATASIASDLASGNAPDIKKAHEAGTEAATISGVLGGKAGFKTQVKEAGYSKEHAEATQKQHEEYTKATNSVEKAEILDKSPELKTHQEIQTLKEYKIPIHSAAFPDAEAAKMAGVKPGKKPLTETELNTKIKDENGETITLGEGITRGYKDLKSSTISTVDHIQSNVDKMIKGTNKEYNANRTESTTGSAKIKAQENTDLNAYNDSLKALKKAYKDPESTPERIKEAATAADEAYNALPKLERSHIDQLNKDIGNNKQIDHINDASRFNGVSQRVESMLPGKSFKPAPKESLVSHGVLPAAAEVTLGHGSGYVIAGAKAAVAGAKKIKQFGTAQEVKAAGREAEANKGTLPEGQAPEGLAPQTGEKQTTAVRYGAAKYAQNKQQELERIKSTFNNPEIADRVNLSNMSKPDVIKNLKAQDNAQNVEKIRATNQAKSKAQQNTYNVKHEEATQELNRWSKEEGQFIPDKYIQQAKEQVAKVTPEGNRITDASRVKKIAMKNFQAGEKVGAIHNGKKDQFYHIISNNLPKEAQQAAKEHIDNLYKGKQKLEGDDLKSAIKDVYEIGSKHYGDRAEGRALVKRGNRMINAITARDLAGQHSSLSSAMKQQFKTTHEEISKSGESKTTLTPEEQQDFIDHRLSEIFKARKEPMTKTELRSTADKLKEEVNNHAKSWSEKTASEKASSMGASKEDVEEIAKNMPNGKISADDSKHILTDLKNNYTEAIQSGNVSNIRDLLTSNKGIAQHLDQQGGKVAMHNRFEGTVENIADRMENMPKGYDKKALISREEYDHISGGNAQGYKSDLLKIAGVSKPEELLTESKRSQLEADTRSGKQAARNQAGAKMASSKAAKERLQRSALAAKQNKQRVIRPKA